MYSLLGDLYSFIFARKFFYRLNRFLFMLALRGMGCGNFKSLSQSGELSFIKKYIRPLAKPVCFDVGANKGEYSMILAKYLPEAEIHAFEPHPSTFKTLEKNLEQFENVKVNNFAFSNSAGTTKLWDYNTEDGTSHASLSRASLIRSDTEKVVEVEARMSTIDEYLRENGIEKVHFLKVDVEGHEIEVLKGAVNALTEGKIEIIQLEFTQANSACGVFVKTFFDILAENYHIHRILRDDIIPLKEYSPVFHELMAFQNFVAIKKQQI